MTSVEAHSLFFSCSCFFHLLSFHAIFLDLSLMEEWSSGGKALERHDESPAHCRCPMARSQSLKDPPTKSKQHLQNPVDMHKFKHGYQKPSNYLSFSFSLLSLTLFLPSPNFSCSLFMETLHLFTAFIFPTKKRLSTAKKTGRESLAYPREINRLVFQKKRFDKSTVLWTAGLRNRMNSIIAELETAENNLPNRPFYCHVCISPPSRRPSDRTERSGRITTTVQYLAEGGMILLCVGLRHLLMFFSEQCRNSLELFVVCMYCGCCYVTEKRGLLKKKT